MQRFGNMRRVVFAALLALGACADLLDIPQDPVLASVDTWTCMTPPAAAAPTSARALVRVHTCNFVSTNCSSPVTGLKAQLCEKRDVNCAAPLKVDLPDENGEFHFDVPTGGVGGPGFEGYLRISAPTELCTNYALFGSDMLACALAPNCDPTQPDENCRIPTYAPSMLFFNPPVKADVAAPIVVPLIPSAATVSLVEAAGSRIADPTSGSVFVTVLGCDGRPAAGATIRVSPQPASSVATVYVVDGVISAAASETDSSGIGGLLGVRAGFARVAARAGAAPDSPEIAAAGIQVAPLTMTYVTLAPTAQ